MEKNQINNFKWGVIALILVLCLSIGIVGGLAYYSTTFAPSILEQQAPVPVSQPSKTTDETSDCCGGLQHAAATVAERAGTHTATIGINVYCPVFLQDSYLLNTPAIGASDWAKMGRVDVSVDFRIVDGGYAFNLSDLEMQLRAYRGYSSKQICGFALPTNRIPANIDVWAFKLAGKTQDLNADWVLPELTENDLDFFFATTPDRQSIRVGTAIVFYDADGNIDLAKLKAAGALTLEDGTYNDFCYTADLHYIYPKSVLSIGDGVDHLYEIPQTDDVVKLVFKMQLYGLHVQGDTPITTTFDLGGGVYAGSVLNDSAIDSLKESFAGFFEETYPNYIARLNGLFWDDLWQEVRAGYIMGSDGVEMTVTARYDLDDHIKIMIDDNRSKLIFFGDDDTIDLMDYLSEMFSYAADGEMFYAFSRDRVNFLWDFEVERSQAGTYYAIFGSDKFMTTVYLRDGGELIEYGFKFCKFADMDSAGFFDLIDELIAYDYNLLHLPDPITGEYLPKHLPAITRSATKFYRDPDLTIETNGNNMSSFVTVEMVEHGLAFYAVFEARPSVTLCTRKSAKVYFPDNIDTLDLTAADAWAALDVPKDATIRGIGTSPALGAIMDSSIVSIDDAGKTFYLLYTNPLTITYKIAGRKDIAFDVAEVEWARQETETGAQLALPQSFERYFQRGAVASLTEYSFVGWTRDFVDYTQWDSDAWQTIQTVKDGSELPLYTRSLTYYAMCHNTGKELFATESYFTYAGDVKPDVPGLILKPDSDAKQGFWGSIKASFAQHADTLNKIGMAIVGIVIALIVLKLLAVVVRTVRAFKK